MKHDPYIAGEANTNLGVYLPKMEANVNSKVFSDILVRMAKDDPENFQLGFVTINGVLGPQEWPVVVGFHPLKRFLERTFMTKMDIMNQITRILRNPLIGPRVVRNTISYDDVKKKVVADNDAGVKTTTIKVEASGIVYIFEAGYSYIRLVTVWSGNVAKFVGYDTATITITKANTLNYSKNA